MNEILFFLQISINQPIFAADAYLIALQN